MLPYIYFAVLLINLIAYLSGKKSKFLSVVSVIFVVVFVAGIRYNETVIGYDLRNYAIHYANPETIGGTEIGFKAVNYLGKMLGLSFEQFYMVLVSVCLCVVFLTVNRMKCNMHLFLVAYMLYFIMCPMSQLRNMCAFAVFIHAFPLFRTGSSPKNMWRIYAHILVAALFHFTFILFLIYPLMLKRKNKAILKGGIIVLILGTVLTLLKQGVVIGKLFAPLMGLLGSVVVKYLQYFSTPTGIAPLCSIIILVVVMLALKYWDKRCVKPYSQDVMLLGENANGIKRVCLLTSYFILLVLLNVTNYRFIRDISLICIAHIGINNPSKYAGLKTRVCIVGYTMAISIGWFLFDIVIKGYWQSFLDGFFVNALI